MAALLRSLGLAGGRAGTQLEINLRSITEGDSIDVPKDVMTSVVQASHQAYDRREIMKHVQDCLTETNNKRWRRIYCALMLIERLLQNGGSVLVNEIGEGHHFDLVQHLSSLEKFEYGTDRRVQGSVRTMAGSLRDDLLKRLHAAGGHSAAVAATTAPIATGSSSAQETADSRRASATVGGATAGGAAAGFVQKDNNQPKPVDSQKGQTVLNGIVAVGHRDDSTSDSSGDERPVRHAGAAKPREARHAPARSRGGGGNAGDSDSSPGGRPAAALPPPPTVNLLDF
eukprot:NODE_15295_length_1058_cov_2.820623.p1 GENE.NODE_15295_length_1058_cov_2.820623~~NODE_15295_length_1058_cov_2.820623.p1  ORF type:complete len:285 (+),score=90.90 NODE_15295_length_1058_cov_2.820623:161-1015(+)